MVEAGATLLDVRHPEEWEAGHAPAAVFLPLDQLGDRYTELTTDQRSW
jgi:rhodanese-related sulfurtransferase